MQLLVLGRILGQDISHSYVRGIDLHELTGWIRMDQNGSCGEAVLKVQECSVSSWGPRERELGRGEC